jgi:hypothetical protein
MGEIRSCPRHMSFDAQGIATFTSIQMAMQCKRGNRRNWSTASARRSRVGLAGMLASSFPKGLPALGDRRQLRDEVVGLAFRTRVFSDAELTLESKPLQSSRLVRSGDPLALGATVDRTQTTLSFGRMHSPVVSRSTKLYYVRSNQNFAGPHRLICANGQCTPSGRCLRIQSERGSAFLRRSGPSLRRTA